MDRAELFATTFLPSFIPSSILNYSRDGEMNLSSLSSMFIHTTIKWGVGLTRLPRKQMNKKQNRNTNGTDSWKKDSEFLEKGHLVSCGTKR